MDTLDRREFVRRSSKAGLAAVASCGLGYWLYTRSRHPREESSAVQVRSYGVHARAGAPLMVVVTGGEPAQLVTAAISSLGGMNAFVSRGDVVVLKPNVGWDRVPVQAANTNPELVKTVAELCFSAGAKRRAVHTHSVALILKL